MIAISSISTKVYPFLSFSTHPTCSLDLGSLSVSLFEGGCNPWFYQDFKKRRTASFTVRNLPIFQVIYPLISLLKPDMVLFGQHND
jgi:uncharacterized membrane protein